MLADPSPTVGAGSAKVGRVLTSVVAIACLRAQQGVTPQVSLVFILEVSVVDTDGFVLLEIKGHFSRLWFT